MNKKIAFKNNKRQKIVGILNIPNGNGPFPAVVICHGFRGYKEQGHLKTLATELAQNGIVAFRFDFGNGVGQSYGKLESISFGQYLDDIKTVVDYLAKRSFVDKNRIGLSGHSFGGQLVLHYAPTDERIKVLVDLAGVVLRGAGKTHMEKVVKPQLSQAKKNGYFFIHSSRTGKKYKIKTDYYFELMKYNTPSQIKKIKIPVLIIHGSKDETVNLDHSRLVYKLVKGKKKLVVIPGATHNWRGKSDPGGKFQKKINPIIVDWLKKYL